MGNRILYLAVDEPVGGIVSGTAIRPQRDRARPQEGWEEAAKPDKKPERKKSNVKRRGPSRGRYVDEYAQPVNQPS